MLRPERQHPLPSRLGRRAVVNLSLLVHKAVVGVVAENLGVFAGCPDACLELVYSRRRAPIVPISEMRLQRHLDVSWFGHGLRRQAVEADRGREFGYAGCA